MANKKIETESVVENPIDEGVTDNAPTEEIDDGSPKYSKEYFLKSNWYSHKRDSLNALLEDGKEYSVVAVEKLLAKK